MTPVFEIINLSSFSATLEFVPPFAIGKTPAVLGRLVKSDQLGAPAAVFIKIVPVVALGANKLTAPASLP